MYLIWQLLEGLATHSGILAWRIPWTEEPGGLQSLELQRVGHDWNGLAYTHALLKRHIWSGHPTCRDRSEAQAVKWVDHLDNKQRTWDLDLLIPIPDSALLATRATPFSRCCRIDKCSILIAFPLCLVSLCPPILPQYWGQRPLVVGQISWFKLERKTRAGLLAPGGQGVAWVLPLSSGSRSEVADLVRVWGGGCRCISLQP